MTYDVFISCKSEDYAKAESVYHWLTERGYKPFFAPISLRISKIHGEPVVFGDEIDAALEEANNMIVYSSHSQYVETGYVKDEWRTFVEEQRAGRKNGTLITILDNVNIADLPIRLRSVQSFTPSNYKEGILRFLGNPHAQMNLSTETEYVISNTHHQPADRVEDYLRKAKMSFDNKLYVEAFHLFKLAAEQESPEAMFYLGRMLMRGYKYNITGNNDEATDWYRKSANLGYAPAQKYIGDQYLNQSHDKALAVLWYRKAANQGNTDAQKALKALGF